MQIDRLATISARARCGQPGIGDLTPLIIAAAVPTELRQPPNPLETIYSIALVATGASARRTSVIEVKETAMTAAGIQRSLLRHDEGAAAAWTG